MFVIFKMKICNYFFFKYDKNFKGFFYVCNLNFLRMAGLPSHTKSHTITHWFTHTHTFVQFWEGRSEVGSESQGVIVLAWTQAGSVRGVAF